MKTPSRARPRSAPPPAPPAWRPAWLAAALVALALRLWHVAAGAPYLLDEAIPLRRAIAMWGVPPAGPDLDPHFFHYPSLALYLEFALQHALFAAGHLLGRWASASDFLLDFATDPTPVAVAARVLGVACDLATLWAAARIAERLRAGAGTLAAWLVALSPALVATARGINTDTFLATFATLALERLLAWRARGGRGTLVAAVVLAGLALGAKYPAAVLLLPLAWCVIERRGARGVLLVPAAAAGVLAVFLATTPYALVDRATFAGDVSFVSAMAGEGQLGNLEQRGAGYYLGALAANVGWVGVALVVVALALALGRRGAAARPLVLALAGFGVPLALSRIEAERYLAPLVPLAAALVALAAGVLRAALPARARTAGALALAALLVVPPAWNALRVALRAGDDTRVAASLWYAAHVQSDALVIEEDYGAAIASRLDHERLAHGALFAAAGPAARARCAATPWRRIVRLPLSVVGRCEIQLDFEHGAPLVLPFFPHAVDLNQVFYEPRLYAAADYVVTSGGVRGRFAADSVRFAAQRRFYAWLDHDAAVAARFAPGAGIGGPEIVVYRLGERAKRSLAEPGALDPLWWAASVPQDFRSRAERALLPPARRGGGALREANGRPAAWVRALEQPFAERIEPLLLQLAEELADLHRDAAARAAAEAVLAERPDDPQARALIAALAARPR